MADYTYTQIVSGGKPTPNDWNNANAQIQENEIDAERNTIAIIENSLKILRHDQIEAITPDSAQDYAQDYFFDTVNPEQGYLDTVFTERIKQLGTYSDFDEFTTYDTATRWTSMNENNGSVSILSNQLYLRALQSPSEFSFSTAATRTQASFTKAYARWKQVNFQLGDGAGQHVNNVGFSINTSGSGFHSNLSGPHFSFFTNGNWNFFIGGSQVANGTGSFPHICEIAAVSGSSGGNGGRATAWLDGVKVFEGDANLTGTFYWQAGVSTNDQNGPTDDRYTIDDWFIYNGGASTTFPIYDTRKGGQKFRPLSTGFFTGVKIRGYKASTSSTTITAKIETNNAGAPSGTLVDAAATGTIILTDTGTETHNWYNIEFDNPVQLTGGTDYWLVISSSAADSSNQFNWPYTPMFSVLTNGGRSEYNGSSWAPDTDSDFCFTLESTSAVYDDGTNSRHYSMVGNNTFSSQSYKPDHDRLMCQTPTLYDNFNDNSFNGTLWTRSSATYVVEQNQRLEVTGQVATTHYVHSNTAYPLYVFKLVSRNANSNAWISVGQGSSNETQVITAENLPSSGWFALFVYGGPTFRAALFNLETGVKMADVQLGFWATASNTSFQIVTNSAAGAITIDEFYTQAIDNAKLMSKLLKTTTSNVTDTFMSVIKKDLTAADPAYGISVDNGDTWTESLSVDEKNAIASVQGIQVYQAIKLGRQTAIRGFGTMLWT